MNGMLDQLQLQKILDGGCSSQYHSYQFWLPFLHLHWLNKHMEHKGLHEAK